MGLNGYIFIFIMVKNYLKIENSVQKKKKKKEKTIAIEGFRVDNKTYLAQDLWLPDWSEGPPKCKQILSSTTKTFA